MGSSDCAIFRADYREGSRLRKAFFRSLLEPPFFAHCQPRMVVRSTDTGSMLKMEDDCVSHKGFSHIGLSTLDLDKTREFYEGVLGFKPVRCDTITVKEGGKIRHIFFDTGRDELIAFMEAKGIDGIPAEYDAGIMTPASTAGWAYRAPSTTSLSRPAARLDWSRSARS